MKMIFSKDWHKDSQEFKWSDGLTRTVTAFLKSQNRKLIKIKCDFNLG